MIKRLTCEFVDRISTDFPTLEKLNLSNNGKINFSANVLELTRIENLERFSVSLKILNVSNNRLLSVSDVPEHTSFGQQNSYGVSLLVNLVHLDLSRNLINCLDGL